MRTLFGFAIGVVLLTGCPVARGADEAVRLRDNIVRQLTATVPKAVDAEPGLTVAAAVDRLRPDGGFADLDYRPDPLTNQPFKHVGRLHAMSVAWACPASPGYQDPKLKAAVLAAYGWWVDHDIQHRNWWYNQIGVPDSLSEIMLILQAQDALPADRFAKAIAIVDRALPHQPTLTAANLVWTAVATRNEGVLRACDPAATDADRAAATALVRQSSDRIGSTVKLTTSDGINVDWSFHAHGVIAYNGGYGSAWIVDTAAIAASAAGTDLGLGDDRVRLLVDYVLGGDQYMVRGVNYDLAVSGRGWSRSDLTRTALGLRGAVAHLTEAAPGYRTAELAAFGARLDHAAAAGAADPADTAFGNRAYYTADYMAQQRPAYLISVKTASKRASLPEAMNGDNRKTALAYDGLNLVYRTGNEYDAVEPLWDWYRLPGTTEERAAGGTGGAYPLLPPTPAHRGGTAVAGGASDGSVGAHAFGFAGHGITALKSWFLFDAGEVALGCDIAQPKPVVAGERVGTNVNQTRLDGPVVYAADGGLVTLGVGQSVTPRGLRWVHHDGVGYFFPTPVDDATIRTVVHTGAWSEINLGGYSADPISRPLFDLDLDHGPAPAGAGYAYAVVPGLAAADMDRFWAAHPFTVDRNDAVAQAVTDAGAGLTEANFYAAGDVGLPGGGTLAVGPGTGPLSVLVRRRPDGGLSVSVASPDHRAGPASVQVSGHYAGDGAAWDGAAGRTTVAVDLPAGPRAGATATRTLAAAAR